jgi:hypothetical protein
LPSEYFLASLAVASAACDLQQLNDSAQATKNKNNLTLEKTGAIILNNAK